MQSTGNPLFPGLLVILLTFQFWICGAASIKDSKSSENNLENILDEALKRSNQLLEVNWYRRTQDLVDLGWLENPEELIGFSEPMPGSVLKMVPFILTASYNEDLQSSGRSGFPAESAQSTEFKIIHTASQSVNDNWLSYNFHLPNIQQYNSLYDILRILKNLNQFHGENFKCFFGNECGKKTSRIVRECTSSNSTFRSELNILINHYLLEEETIYRKKNQKTVFENLLDEISSRNTDLKCRNREWMELKLLRLLETYITGVMSKSFSMIVAAHMAIFHEENRNNPSNAHNSLTSAITAAQAFYDYLPNIYLNVEKSLSESFKNPDRCPPERNENGRVLIAADFVKNSWEEKLALLFIDIHDIYQKAGNLSHNLHDIR